MGVCGFEPRSQSRLNTRPPTKTFLNIASSEPRLKLVSAGLAFALMISLGFWMYNYEEWPKNGPFWGFGCLGTTESVNSSVRGSPMQKV